MAAWAKGNLHLLPKNADRIIFTKKQNYWHILSNIFTEKYYLPGHSEGGSLALIHAAQHPHDYPGKVLAAVCNFMAQD